MVDHSIIIERLIEVGVCGNVINWLVSFLSNRTNCLRDGKIMSKFFPMTRGLIQGSLNGPISFILTFDPFLRQLQDIDKENLQIYGFVDDATTAAIENSSDTLITSSILLKAPLATKSK